MTDNVTADPGTGGATFASDEIGGIHYTINKLTFGPLDSQTLAIAGNGVTTAGTQRVTISSDSTGQLKLAAGVAEIGNVKNSGIFAVQSTLNAETTKVIGTVNIAAAQTIAVTNGGTFVVQSTLQAGTAEIGKLAAGVAEIGNVKNSGTFLVQAAQSGIWDLRNITGTVTLPTGAATSAGQLADGHNVTVDNAAGAAAVNIQDGGNSITVDNGGTFQVQATLDAETTKVIGTINMSAGQTIDVTNGGTFVTQATLQAGTAEIGKLAAGVAEIGNVKNSGTFVVQSTLQAGSNLIGDVGLSGARTSGGTTLYKNIDVDESEDAVKASAGQVYWIHAINLTATVVFLKLYNATVASVVVGTTVPDLTFPVPANSTTGAGFTLSIPNGIEFDTAITIAGTTGVADNDSGAPAANALVVNLGFA